MIWLQCPHLNLTVSADRGERKLLKADEFNGDALSNSAALFFTLYNQNNNKNVKKLGDWF